MIMLSNVRFGLGHKIWPNPDKKNETVNLGFRLSVLGSTGLKPFFLHKKCGSLIPKPVTTLPHSMQPSNDISVLFRLLLMGQKFVLIT